MAPFLTRLSLLGALFLPAVPFAAGTAAANDGAASIVAGGIVLEKTEAVRIAREDLFISPERIEVAYKFENVTEKDAELTLAFPFPDIFADDIGSQWPDEPEQVRFIDFSTTFNGAPVKAREVVEIISLEGENITQLFREEGFPLAPYADLWQASTWFGDEEKTAFVKARLAALGLLGNFESRKWKTRISYVWDAVFPAGETVKVTHSYRPVAGAFHLAFQNPPAADGGIEAFDHWFRKQYCVSDELFQTLAARPVEERFTFYARETGYVLKTGANWAGPIGAFHLTVDTGAPDAFFSTCWPHELTGTGPQRLEFSATDFTPRHDLLFMTYAPSDMQEGTTE
ncbi:DUF4424 family protein [Tepidicaulis sp. LMO-SS28]|uniref:DUF4424 family protein n=1 Tax=Tepidicaulis sp. LMO-SS28 TaxID=3447455 RepID=UPI003EE3C2FA